MTVWRIYLDPERPSGCQLEQTTFDYCIEHGLLGIGWRLEPDYPVSIEDYERLASNQYQGDGHMAWRSAFNAIREMRQGDFCWTRTPGGNEFHVGLIVGEWTYRWGRPFWDLGLAQTRDCVWRRWAENAVPPGYPDVESRTANRISAPEGEEAAIRAWIASNHALGR